MAGYLIKDTTREERQKIVEESLGNISANCDGCMAGLAEMYQEYIEGNKEIRDINMAFNARYTRGDMEKEEKRANLYQTKCKA
ncbi:MAG: purine biosynthesis protein PurH [Eubacteriales bacterium]|nr:purine biosynthesis protein PurH [Eubacteriales bacterium]